VAQRTESDTRARAAAIVASIPRAVTQGWSFAGTTTLPKFNCEGFLGPVFSLVLTSLISGPENPSTIKITAPSP
jgi:hypothetical protein